MTTDKVVCCDALPTIHEVGQVDFKVALLGVIIREDAIVWEIPAKCIWNNDNDAFRRFAVWWLTHICVETIEIDDFAFG